MPASEGEPEGHQQAFREESFGEVRQHFIKNVVNHKPSKNRLLTQNPEILAQLMISSFAVAGNRIIKIRMLLRANTAKNILPQPRDSFTRHREAIHERTRQIFSKQSSRSTQRIESTAGFTTTCRTNHFFKPQSQQQRYRDSSPHEHIRPFTQDSGRFHRAPSPLSVIRTKSRGISNEQAEADQRSIFRKTQFLRRGSGLDKAIISNVLRSKFNKNVCAPAFSYCDEPKNQQLLAVIAGQIPKGIRDVVGVQQMLRMSHIFTGTQFKNSSLTKRLNSTLSQAKALRKHSNIIEEEDTVTLKSIKRW